jgi:hypothetical protein
MAIVAIPDDFPRGAPKGAVPGAQPKLLVREEAGRFVSARLTDSEVQGRYEVCEDLVQQLVRYSSRKQAGHPNWTPAQVRETVATSVRLKAFGWGLSPDEAEWIVRRLAAIGGGGAPTAGAGTTS